jgi:DNA-binding beta-propeller fold protein YncE
MAITADASAAFVSIWGAGEIARLDLTPLGTAEPTTISVDGSVSVGKEAHPYSVSFAPGGRHLFVANTQAKYVSVIDTSDLSEKRIQVAAIGGRAVAYTPDEKFALVTLETISKLAVIDLTDLRVTRYIDTGPGPRGLAVDKAASVVYVSAFDRTAMFPGTTVSDYGPNTLTMVDLGSGDLSTDSGQFRTEVVPVGYGPCSVSLFETKNSQVPPSKLEEIYA